jgi:hypothetical protein
VVVSGFLALLVAGCSTSSTPSPAPAPSMSSASSGRVYQATDDLCGRVDRAGLSATLGKLLESRPGPVTPGGLVTQQTCTLQYGEPTARIPVEVSIQLATNGGSVADYYLGLRKVTQANGPLTPVPGLGQDAYAYTNGIGPHLVAYDGNLYLSYAVITGALPPGKVPSGIDAAEVTSARATMTALAK